MVELPHALGDCLYGRRPKQVVLTEPKHSNNKFKHNCMHISWNPVYKKCDKVIDGI